MARKSLPVVGLVTALLLAGCLGAGEEAAPEAASDINATNTTVPEALPEGRDGEFAAFKETNATEEGKGGLDHHHDYWAGQTRVDLFTIRSALQPSPRGGAPATVVRMPQGAFVYEATAQVEVLLSNPSIHVCEPSGATINGKYTCTDDNGYGVSAVPAQPHPAPPAVTLEYMHAAASEWIPVGEVTWDTPIVIPITSPIETDMPHSTSSLWQFRVSSASPLDHALTFDVAATIQKGGDNIPLWPGHPDFYASTRFRDIWEGRVTVRESGQLGQVLPRDWAPVRPEKLISYGTKTLYIYVNITDFKEPVPPLSPTTWYMYFHNASGDWNITDIFDPNYAVGSGTSFLFVLPVDDAGMDTPYGTASRWEFLMRGAFENVYSGAAAYEVTYDMKIVATDLPPGEGLQYNCGGLGEDWCPESDGA